MIRKYLNIENDFINHLKSVSLNTFNSIENKRVEKLQVLITFIKFLYLILM